MVNVAERLFSAGVMEIPTAKLSIPRRSVRSPGMSTEISIISEWSEVVAVEL